MRTLALLAVLGAFTTLARAEGPFRAEKDEVAFLSDCWSVYLTGPVAREADVKKAAADKLESPSAAALAAARRREIAILVMAHNEMKCGNGPKPLRLVVERGATRRPVTLAVGQEVKQNALGAQAVFFFGRGAATPEEMKALFATDATLYLIFESGPFVKWTAPTSTMLRLWATEAELRAAEAQKAQVAQKRRAAQAAAKDAESAAEVRRRLDNAKASLQKTCAATADYTQQWAGLEFVSMQAEQMKPAPPLDYYLLLADHRECLERLQKNNGTAAATAKKLLEQRPPAN